MLAMARPRRVVSQFMECVMKKALISVITIAVLVGGVILLNRTIPQAKATGPGPVSGTTVAPRQESTLSMQDVVLKGLDGNEVKISDLKGKVVLVDFWGTFCEPGGQERCRALREEHQIRCEWIEGTAQLSDLSDHRRSER
jgi:hypothetical protein